MHQYLQQLVLIHHKYILHSLREILLLQNQIEMEFRKRGNIICTGANGFKLGITGPMAAEFSGELNQAN
jgi:hypothetical protein